MSPDTMTPQLTAFGPEFLSPAPARAGLPAAAPPAPALRRDDDYLADCFEEDPERWDGLS